MRPLSNIRVIEFCSVAAGPFCGMLLADMGADVIKVENPDGGDTMRAWPPFNEGYSENFASLNRNKKSVTLNLKDEADLARARALIESADIVLENNRPGVMKRLGLDYETLSTSHRSLIYCSISAYGQTGPRAKEAGFDLTLQAMSGIMSVTGESGHAPIKCGVPISDFSTGLYAAFAISSALHVVRTTGQGTNIDASMLGASLGIAALQTSEYFGSDRNPRALGSAHPRNAPYQVFRAKDGYFAMAAGNNMLFKAAMDAIGRTDLLADERYKTTSLRALNQHELLTTLEETFSAHTAQSMIDTFRAAGVPSSPINKYSDILADEQVEHMQWIETIDLPTGGSTRTFGFPLRFSDTDFSIYRRPPMLGEHNDEFFSASLEADKRAERA